MCCRRCSLHCVYASRVNNDDVHQGLKAISSDKDMHTLSGVAREKVGDLPLNMCSTLQTIVATLSQSVSWAIIHSFP